MAVAPARLSRRAHAVLVVAASSCLPGRAMPSTHLQLLGSASSCRLASSAAKSRQRSPSLLSPQQVAKGQTAARSQTASIDQPAARSRETTTAANDRINPPASTRPADLDLPDALPQSASPADKVKRYIAVGRAFLSFYKTGLKNVYFNYCASHPLRRSLRLNPYFPSSIPLSPPPAAAAAAAAAGTPPGSTDQAQQAWHRLTRSEFQLVRRAAHDARRIVPFALILIICGEFTPLVVLALGNAITPLTCRVPAQNDQFRRRLAAAKHAALAYKQQQQQREKEQPFPRSTTTTAEPLGLRLFADSYASAAWARSAPAPDIARACAVFGLTGPRWIALPSWVYRRRLARHAAYLQADDWLIARDGGVAALSGPEVSIAVEERGGVLLDDRADHGNGLENARRLTEREHRRWLIAWLARR